MRVKILSFATLPSVLGYCLRNFLIQILSSVLITYRECFPRSQRDRYSDFVSERRCKKELLECLQDKAAQPSHHNTETMAPENREAPARVLSHQPHHMLGHHTQRSARPGGRREEEFCASTARATILYGFAAGSSTNLSQRDSE